MDCEKKIQNEVTEKNEKFVSSFEKLLDSVVSDGKYQWRLIILFMIPFSICYGCAEYNVVLLMSSPDHVCHVPGREVTNFTIEEWYNLTVPWETGPDQSMRHSQCLMYNTSEEVFKGERIANQPLIIDVKNTTIECSTGWDYDDSDWRSTPVTQFNWVCNRKDMVTHIYTIRLAGSALGTLVLSMLSDRFGRKPMFIFTMLLNLIFSSLLLLCPSFLSFGSSMLLMSFAFYTIYQMPFLIVLEVCNQRLRNITTLTSFLALVLSSIYVSMTAWLTGDWKWFVILNHLPLGIFLFFLKFIPESPRWLLSQGKLEECEKMMSHIASVNGTKYTKEMRGLLELARHEERMKIPASKIFTSTVLTKHLFLTCCLLCLGYIFYISISLNVHNMTGNLFINFFIMSIFEIPGNIFGSICSEKLGRRIGTVICMLLASGFILVASFVVADKWASTIVCGVSKLFLTGGVLIIYLQVGELFPTQLRATAYGITGVVGLTGTIFCPNLMALGSENVLVPYYIMCIVGLLAAIVASFLPETLGQPLPQTLIEAKQIGKGQKFFSVIHIWNVAKFHKKRAEQNGSPSLLSNTEY